MRARYYSPAMKRFVNADIVPGEISDAVTLNRFAYANGNPVSFVDPFGLSVWSWLKKNVFEPVADLGKKVVDTAVTVANTVADTAVAVANTVADIAVTISDWTCENVVQPLTTVVNDVKEDIQNYEKGNTDEQKVLDSHYFSSYKGKFVVRTSWERSGSFGALFISHKEESRDDKVYTVMHEYGHTKQLDELGTVDYALFIGIPSLLVLGPGSYYRKPWEITADIYGGVDLLSRKGEDPLTTEHIANGYDYLSIASSDLSIWEKIDRLMHYYLK